MNIVFAIIIFFVIPVIAIVIIAYVLINAKDEREIWLDAWLCTLVLNNLFIIAWGKFVSPDEWWKTEVR